MTARDEQETVISWMADDAVVSVYTSNTVHVRRLRKLASTQSFVRVAHERGDGVEFVIDAAFFHLFSAIRGKRAMSEATKAARAKQLADARELRRSSSVDDAFRDREGGV